MEVKVQKKGGLIDRFKNMRSRASQSISVRVGFLNGHTYTDGTLIADVARNNEYGTGDIPARPFMGKTVEKNFNKWQRIISERIVHEDLETVFDYVGMEAAADIQEQIINWSDPPNSAQTIKAKGFNAPLRDTTTMLHDVSYEVKT